MRCSVRRGAKGSGRRLVVNRRFLAATAVFEDVLTQITNAGPSLP